MNGSIPLGPTTFNQTIVIIKKVKINSQYTATIAEDSLSLTVGCQTISVSALYELQKTFEKQSGKTIQELSRKAKRRNSRYRYAWNGNKSIQIGNKVFINRQLVSGTITGIPFTGMLLIEDTMLFVCQNSVEGHRLNFGIKPKKYKYSYVFQPTGELDCFSEDVKIKGINL